MESEGEEGVGGGDTYCMLHLGACAGRAGACRQGGADREDRAPGCRNVREAAVAAQEHPALPFHADVKHRAEAAPGCSRGLAISAQ